MGELQSAKPEPKIYVACLAAMLKASPIADAEQWAIHDYEDFEDVRISE